MFSIHKKSILASLVGAVAVIGTGCASSSCPCLRPNKPITVTTVAPIAEQPDADEATQLRGWHKTVAAYQSGATPGWPTRFYISPNPDYSTPENVVGDSMIFFLQSASLPVTLVMEPPFKQPVIYAGDVVVPSYTAMPPLPPESAVSRTVPDPDPLGRPSKPVAPALPPLAEPLPPTYVPPAPKPVTKPAKAATVTPTTQPVK